jgi:hypothetical protein
MTMRILRNLRISEISSVDKGAGDGCRIVLFKRDDPSINARIGKQDYSEADDADAKDIDNGDAENETHFAEEVAGLLVRSGRFSSDQEALDFLLGSQHGAALLQRLRQSKRTTKHTHKDFHMPSRSTVLQSIAKQAGGIVPLCKRIIADQSSGDISEHELTALIVANAKREYPDMTDAAAFAKVFGDTSPAGETLRRAIEVAKFSHLLIMPVNVDTGDTDVEDDSDEATAQRRQLNDAQQQRISDADAADTDEDEGDSGPAYEELRARAAAYRKAHPELTEQQAFAKVYQDPGNRKLALRERRQNRPGG